MSEREGVLYGVSKGGNQNGIVRETDLIVRD